MIFVVRHENGDPYVVTASKEVAEDCCHYQWGEYIEEFQVDMKDSIPANSENNEVLKP